MYKTTKSLIAFFKKIAYSLLVVLLAAQIGETAPKKTTKKKVVNDKYAAIVIDAHSGKVLYQQQSNAKRYPASLTKMMTLYMMFEAVQKGRLSMQTQIPVSAYAAARPPTKIGFKPGQTISVEAAAKALITRSANDVASAVAEYLGGSEKKFAQMMTKKAHLLGMKNTNFANASGLPDVNNYTTAQDMARLSLALRKDFAKYYHLFNTTSFDYRGQTIHSHNRLVKTMKGVDGIKTGYVGMSGFNVATSMQFENKSIVAVVMGGRTAASRDAHMRTLLTTYIAKASKGRPQKEPQTPKEAPQDLLIASNEAADLPPLSPTLPLGGKAPLPILKVRAQPPTPSTPIKPDNATQAIQVASIAIPRTKPTKENIVPSSDREHDAALLTALTTIADKGDDNALVFSHIMRKEADNLLDKELDMLTTASLIVPTGTAISNAQKGWVVEVASRPTVREAELMLHKASLAAQQHLTQSERYLKVRDDDNTRLYLARFAGFDNKQAAYSACDMLKKADIDCHPLKD